MTTYNPPSYSVRSILKDNWNWEKYKLSHKHLLRPEQIKEVDSMLLCQDPSQGFFYYYCPHCDLHITCHKRCNSRICSRCGKNYVDKWAEQTTKRLLQVDHSHITFTLPDIIWNLIKDNFDCIRELSQTAYTVLKETMSQTAKQHITPGVISSLHTYGEDLKYNIHFHNIVTNGGNKKNGEWKAIDYFPFRLLRMKWKHKTLDTITQHIPLTTENIQLLQELRYDRYHEGFNVCVIKTKIPKKELITYIARYLRHPPISNRRITNYDGHSVTILCEKKKTYTLTFTIEEFITRLIQHIPAKGFKLIRHYGLYSRTKRPKIKTIKQENITKYITQKNSIRCPKCDQILDLIEYFPPSFTTGPPKKQQQLTNWIELI